jgi:hypothetical protein
MYAAGVARDVLVGAHVAWPPPAVQPGASWQQNNACMVRQARVCDRKVFRAEGYRSL